MVKSIRGWENGKNEARNYDSDDNPYTYGNQNVNLEIFLIFKIGGLIAVMNTMRREGNIV